MVPGLERAPDGANLIDRPVDHNQQAFLLVLGQCGQVQLERLLEQRIAFLLTIGGAGHLDHRFIVVAEPAGQRLVAGHPAARGECDLEQLAGGEYAVDVLRSDEYLGST